MSGCRWNKARGESCEEKERGGQQRDGSSSSSLRDDRRRVNVAMASPTEAWGRRVTVTFLIIAVGRRGASTELLWPLFSC